MKKILSAILTLALVLALCMMPAMAEEAKGADVKGTGVPLTVYTNSGSSGRAEWLTERAAQDGYTLTIVEEGANDVKNRLINEGSATPCDVVYGLNAIVWNELIANGIVDAIDAPSWAEEVSAGLNDPTGHYYAIVKQATLLAWDKNAIGDGAVPSDWTDLWENEEFWGRYEVPTGLGGGTTRNVLTHILTQYMDPEGELGISDAGWEAVTGYFAHGVPAEDGVDLYAQFVNADSPVQFGNMWSSGADQYDEMYGTSTGYAIPEVGIPYAVEGVALVSYSANKEEAKRFIEWFGSAQIQGEWSEKFNTMPANEVAAEKAPASQVEYCSMPAQDIDWGLVAENIDAWCEKIMLECME